MSSVSPTKTIGIIGITAEGAALCYKTIVSESAKHWGQYHHPDILLHNPSFHTILEAQKKDDWKTVTTILSNSCNILSTGGADYIVIPANSIHFAISDIQRQSVVPVLSMLEVVQQECRRLKYNKVGVLGIGITMSKGLYDKVMSEVGIQTVIPSAEDQQQLNQIIYEEIVPGKIQLSSTVKIVSIIEKLKKEGCDSVLLACTELPLVINSENSPLPFIDSTRLLAQKAVEYQVSQ